MAKYFLVFFALIVLPVAARASNCAVPQTFTTGQVLTAAVLNANPVALAACINGNIDNSNIGPAGIYASQIIPNSPTTATFGGTIAYNFTNGVNVTGGNIVVTSGIYDTLGSELTLKANGNRAIYTSAGFLHLAYDSNTIMIDSPAGLSVGGGLTTGGAITAGGGITAAGNVSITGTLTTTVAQGCGTIQGYHMECTQVNVNSNNCGVAGVCGSSATYVFSTAYSAAPVCQVTEVIGGGFGIVPFLAPAPTSTQAVVEWYTPTNNGNTQTEAQLTCIGV